MSMDANDGTVTGRLARYLLQARAAALPEHVAEQAELRILDTLAAMLSGSRLAAGEAAIRFTRQQGGTAEATVVGTDIRTTAIQAALANGMFAHADETDDFEPDTKAHPGSHVVPAALAMAERNGRSGAELVAAVTIGYDICCRFLLALQQRYVRGARRSAEGMGSTMGAATAATALAHLDGELPVCYAFSYAAQQVSGIWSWVRDAEHVEKAFDFSGMGARNGVTAAVMAELGFTGVRDVFDGENNALAALSGEPLPERLLDGLGERFFVTETSIKPYSVGYPIQAPLAAFLALRREFHFAVDDVERVVVRLPEDGARIVNGRDMPDVNCQHVLALAIVDGDVSFDSSHDRERMNDPRIRDARGRIELVADKSLMNPAAARSGHVAVTRRDGSVVERFVSHAPGTKENPMNRTAVEAKARALIAPVLGDSQTLRLLETLRNLRDLDDVRRLGPLLSAS